MENIKIIGLPVIVSERHRIVLDKNIRTLFNIKRNDEVKMKMLKGFIFVYPFGDEDDDVGKKKLISAGRFNLPMDWVKENEIDLGDFIFLVATDEGILICPKNLELTCIGRIVQ